jgi:hypothetical protein
MGNLNIWWRGPFNPVAQPSDLSFVLELIALKEKCSEGFTIITHLSKLLSTSEVRIRLK